MGGLSRASLWLGKKQDSARMGHEKSATPKREIYKKERGIVMVGIMIPMPYMCHIGKDKDCPLMGDKCNCNLMPESGNYMTLAEQYEHCPLIDLTQYDDDLK